MPPPKDPSRLMIYLERQRASQSEPLDLKFWRRVARVDDASSYLPQEVTR